LAPSRLLESRAGFGTVDGQQNAVGLRAAGTTTEVHIADRGSVPADASAVVLNVTAAEAQGAGYITVYPCGTERPNASNLNYTNGTTIPNAVITRIGAGGNVCIYNSAPSHLIIDVNGYFPG